ncbi:hypothetical protein SFRURICE_001568, partial [Spodoptera frugiperda]
RLIFMSSIPRHTTQRLSRCYEPVAWLETSRLLRQNITDIGQIVPCRLSSRPHVAQQMFLAGTRLKNDKRLDNRNQFQYCLTV